MYELSCEEEREKKKHTMDDEDVGMLAQELEALRNPPDMNGADSPRGVGRDLLLRWCAKAVGRMFVTGVAGGGSTLSDCGARLLRTLFLVLVENQSLWSPALCQWLQLHVLPCLFPQKGTIDAAHASVTYEMMQALLTLTSDRIGGGKQCPDG